MDNQHGPDNTVVVRDGDIIYDGRTDSYPARYRNNSGTAAHHPGTAGFVTVTS